jgi:dephospho-CoA kinase
VIGMSGVGKSTLLDELSRRGYETVDTDYGGWQLPDGTWDEQRMGALLDQHVTVVVSGAVDNQGRFYDRFHHVVLLSAPVAVLVERVVNRSNNLYGEMSEQPADIERYLREVEPFAGGDGETRRSASGERTC